MICCRASAVLGPALLTDERHERHCAEILLLEFCFILPRELDQRLVPHFTTDRNDKTTAYRELIFQRLRHIGSARSDQDRVKRSGFGPSAGAVAYAQIDVIVTDILDPLPGRCAERRMSLKGVNATGDQTDDSRGIAGTGTHFEHLIAGPDFGRFDHQRDNVRLRDRLIFADRQRSVFVGKLLESGVDERLARHATHRIQHARITHAAPGDLNIDHPVPIASTVYQIQHWTLLASSGGLGMLSAGPRNSARAVISLSRMLVVCSVRSKTLGPVALMGISDFCVSPSSRRNARLEASFQTPPLPGWRPSWVERVASKARATIVGWRRGPCRAPRAG